MENSNNNLKENLTPLPQSREVFKYLILLKTQEYKRKFHLSSWQIDLSYESLQDMQDSLMSVTPNFTYLYCQIFINLDLIYEKFHSLDQVYNTLFHEFYHILDLEVSEIQDIYSNCIINAFEDFKNQIVRRKTENKTTLIERYFKLR